jgi:hypothetical protein
MNEEQFCWLCFEECDKEICSICLQEYEEYEYEDKFCWICFEECDEIIPCNCTQYVHSKCLAKWQIRKVGTDEEKICRFCDIELPDWRYVLRPDYDELSQHEVSIACSIRRGRPIQIAVMPDTPKETFVEIVKAAFNTNDDVLEKFSFLCDIPDEDINITFQGIKCYEAMLFCARVSHHDKRKNDIKNNIQDVSEEPIQYIEQINNQSIIPERKYNFLRTFWKDIVRSLT